MRDLTLASASITSAEIAELVGSRHDSVKRTIERLVEGGVIVQPPLVDEPGSDAMGRPRPVQMFRFTGDQGKRDSIVVVAQLSPEFTARLVDRWQELESRASDPMRILSDPAAMRGLLLGYTEKVLALESEVAEQAPKVAALDRIATSDGAICITRAAKDLQVRPKDLFQWMQANSWIYRRPGSGFTAYQPRIQQGVLLHKVSTIERSDGTEKMTEQVLVTAKGLAKLSELIGKFGIAV